MVVGSSKHSVQKAEGDGVPETPRPHLSPPYAAEKEVVACVMKPIRLDV